jgi:hypothetical protein
MTSLKSRFLNRRGLAIGIGFLLGLFHVGIFVLSATGGGHGPGDYSRFVGPVFFGVASLCWFVIPPFQFAIYADVAFRRDRKLGLILAFLHYASGFLLLLFVGRGDGILDTKHAEFNLNTLVLDVLVTYLVFAILNIIFFRRILSGPR